MLPRLLSIVFLLVFAFPTELLVAEKVSGSAVDVEDFVLSNDMDGVFPVFQVSNEQLGYTPEQLAAFDADRKNFLAKPMPAPANDSCHSARQLFFGEKLIGNPEGGTTTDPCKLGGIDVWYWFTPPYGRDTIWAVCIEEFPENQGVYEHEMGGFPGNVECDRAAIDCNIMNGMQCKMEGKAPRCSLVTRGLVKTVWQQNAPAQKTYIVVDQLDVNKIMPRIFGLFYVGVNYLAPPLIRLTIPQSPINTGVIADSDQKLVNFCATGQTNRRILINGSAVARNGGTISPNDMVWSIARGHGRIVGSNRGEEVLLEYSGQGPFNTTLRLDVTEFTKKACGWEAINAMGIPFWDTLHVYGYVPNPEAGKDTSVCYGKCFRLGVLAPKHGCEGGEVSVVWSPTTGISDINSLNPTVCPTVTTTYTLTVKCGSGTAFKDCNKVDDIVVEVFPKAPAKFSDDSPKCADDLVTFFNESDPNTRRWEWSWGDGSTPETFTTYDASHKYTRSGYYTVRLVAFTQEGCTDTFYKDVIVQAPPEGTLELVTYDECTGTATFRVRITGSGSGNLTYDWDFNGDNTYDKLHETAPTISYSYLAAGLQGTFRPKVRMVDSLGCTRELTYNQPLVIQPALDIVVNSLSMNRCKKEVCLQATVSGGDTPYEYSWDWNNDQVPDNTVTGIDNSCNTLPLVIDFNDNSFKVSLRVRDQRGCAAVYTYSGTMLEQEDTTYYCADFDALQPANYIGDVFVPSNVSVLCDADIKFYHFIRPNAGLDDTINEQIRLCAARAYDEASTNPIKDAISSELHGYPELHEVISYTNTGERVDDFSNTVVLNLFYPQTGPIIPQTESKFRIFELDTVNCQWNVLKQSKAHPESKYVEATLAYLGRVFTILEYTPPEKVLDNVGNFPNPFNPGKGAKRGTHIVYTLTQDCDVTIKIYTSTGGLVREYNYAKGSPSGGTGKEEGIWHDIKWDGTNSLGRYVSNGMYIMYIEAVSAVDAIVHSAYWKIAVSK